MIRYCAELTGNEIAIESDPETCAADMPYYVTDNSALTADTSWQPQRPLPEALTNIRDWLAGNRAVLEPILGDSDAPAGAS